MTTDTALFDSFEKMKASICKLFKAGEMIDEDI